MNSADILTKLWALCLQYPGQASMLAVVLWLLCITVVLSIMAMTRPEAPADRRRDDDDQHRSVSKPAPLESWRRSGSNWWPKL